MRWMVGLALCLSLAAQTPRSPEYSAVQACLAQGWNTWDVHSVAAQVLLPGRIHHSRRAATEHHSELRWLPGQFLNRTPGPGRRAGLSRPTYLEWQLYRNALILARTGVVARNRARRRRSRTAGHSAFHEICHPSHLGDLLRHSLEPSRQRRKIRRSHPFRQWLAQSPRLLDRYRPSSFFHPRGRTVSCLLLPRSGWRQHWPGAFSLRDPRESRPPAANRQFRRPGH